MKWIESNNTPPRLGYYHIKNDYYDNTGSAYWNGSMWKKIFFNKCSNIRIGDRTFTHWREVDECALKRIEAYERMSGVF